MRESDVDPAHIGQVLDITGYKKEARSEVRKPCCEHVGQRVARLIKVNSPDDPIVVLSEHMPDDPATAHAKITGNAKCTSVARGNLGQNLLKSRARDASTDSKDGPWL